LKEVVCEFEHPKVTKTMVAREKAEDKMKRVVARQMPTDEQWNGLRVLVDDRLRSVAFDDAAMQLGWVFVREAKDAGVFVVQNPAELDDEKALAAALSGGWAMAPDTLVRRSGICLKF
jgi:DNA-binding transcriptional LysR family regulator